MIISLWGAFCQGAFVLGGLCPGGLLSWSRNYEIYHFFDNCLILYSISLVLNEAKYGQKGFIRCML